MPRAEEAPGSFGLLLVVQEHDTAADQLVHRRASLPQRAELTEVERQLTALERERHQTATSRREVDGRLRSLEGELAGVESHLTAEEARLYAGTVSVARELQAMSVEVESLRRRRSGLEDQVLGTMTELDPLDERERELLDRRGRFDAEGSRLRAALAEAETDIDEELVGVRSRRSEAAAHLDAALVALYEKVRARGAGVGVATLSGGRCGGCHLGLPAVEVERLRRLAPDELAYCDHCGRILVRV